MNNVGIHQQKWLERTSLRPWSPKRVPPRVSRLIAPPPEASSICLPFSLVLISLRPIPPSGARTRLSAGGRNHLHHSHHGGGSHGSLILAILGSMVVFFQLYMTLKPESFMDCTQLLAAIAPIPDPPMNQFTVAASAERVREARARTMKRLAHMSRPSEGEAVTALAQDVDTDLAASASGWHAAVAPTRGVIGVYSIFIGVYKHFFDGFIANIREHFVPTYRKIFFIVTDDVKLCERLADDPDFQCVIKQKIGWPYESLNRWAYFKEFDTTGTDYIWFFNSNAQCVETITEEVLAPHTAVLHDIYVDKPYWVLCVEKRPISHAFVPDRPYYKYYGARLYGASTQNFLRMCDVLERHTRLDEMSQFIALWHDESHFNHYINVVLDTKVKELGPEYHVPEEEGADYMPGRKMVYLDKKKHIPNLNSTKSPNWQDWIGGKVKHQHPYFQVPEFRPYLYGRLNVDVAEGMTEEEMIQDYLSNFEDRRYYHETGVFAATFDAARYASYYGLESEIAAKAEYYRVGYKEDRYYFLQAGAEDYGLTMPTVVKASEPDPEKAFDRVWGRIGLDT